MAKGKFVGIGVPGMTECYIDDAVITAKSADSSIARTIEGEGLKYDEWYGQGSADEDVYVPKDETEEPIIIKYAALEGLEEANTENGNYYSGSSDNSGNNSYSSSDGSETEEDSDKKKTTTKQVKVKVKKPSSGSADEETGLPVWPFIAAGAAAVLAIAGVTTAIVVKKRKSGSKQVSCSCRRTFGGRE